MIKKKKSHPIKLFLISMILPMYEMYSLMPWLCLISFAEEGIIHHICIGLLLIITLLMMWLYNRNLLPKSKFSWSLNHVGRDFDYVSLHVLFMCCSLHQILSSCNLDLMIVSKNPNIKYQNFPTVC